MTEAADGTLNNLREERNEQCNLCKISFCSDFTAINVYNIACCLKGIEGNTKGQQKAVCRCFTVYTEQRKYTEGLLGKEIEIFKEHQQTKTKHKAECKYFSFLFLNLGFQSLFLIPCHIGMLFQVSFVADIVLIKENCHSINNSYCVNNGQGKNISQGGIL